MDSLSRVLRLGIAAILCAVTLELFADGVPEKVRTMLSKPNISAFLTYLETPVGEM